MHQTERQWLDTNELISSHRMRKSLNKVEERTSKKYFNKKPSL